MFHCKTLIVDGLLVNDEANLNVYDPAFAEAATRSLKPIWNRPGASPMRNGCGAPSRKSCRKRPLRSCRGNSDTLAPGGEILWRRHGGGHA